MSNRIDALPTATNQDHDNAVADVTDPPAVGPAGQRDGGNWLRGWGREVQSLPHCRLPLRAGTVKENHSGALGRTVDCTQSGLQAQEGGNEAQPTR